MASLGVSPYFIMGYFEFTWHVNTLLFPRISTEMIWRHLVRERLIGL